MIVYIVEIGNPETERNDWRFEVVTGKCKEVVLRTFLSLEEAVVWCDNMGYEVKYSVEFEGNRHFVKL